MWFSCKSSFIAILLLSLPVAATAEEWREFHHEKWSQKSGKIKKKLTYCNRYYYDVDSLVRSPSGYVTLWVKEVSDNDSHYVKKGNPASETIFRKINLWCSQKRYEVIQDDIDGSGANEAMSDGIIAGSYYDRLYQTVCDKN